MNICNYEIMQSEIVGVGPLMVRQSSDQVIRQLYKEVQYWFVLVLKNTAVTIESDWISFAEHLTETQKSANEKVANDFKRSYETQKILIIKMIEQRDEK